MRYKLKQRFWSLSDRYIIKDAEGEAAFEVDSKLLSIGDKLSLRDMEGEELCLISRKMLALRTTYKLTRDGEEAARVVKNLSLVRDRFTIDMPEGEDIKVKGKLLTHEYTFKRGGKRVAKVSRGFFRFPTDSYGIDIEEGEDVVLILAIAVVLDLVASAKEEKEE